jgi:uncharacterized protein YqkB
MNIIFSEEAKRQLEKQLPDNAGILKLVYDTEGCGCAVNGIARLQCVTEREPDDLAAGGNFREVLYAARQEVFFEDELIIDYVPAAKSFLLKSKQQIYNPRMQVTDQRASL